MRGCEILPSEGTDQKTDREHSSQHPGVPRAVARVFLLTEVDGAPGHDANPSFRAPQGGGPAVDGRLVAQAYEPSRPGRGLLADISADRDKDPTEYGDNQNSTYCPPGSCPVSRPVVELHEKRPDNECEEQYPGKKS